MVRMSTIEMIRELSFQGNSYSSIAEQLNVSWKTVQKYASSDYVPTNDIQDYTVKHMVSKLDPYKGLIDELMEKQAGVSRKQRWTASRMHEYLWKELKIKELENSYQLVQRYMKHKRYEMKRNGGAIPGSLPLVWHPGEAQADFGEADFLRSDNSIERWKFFIMSFPHSNRVASLIMPGENCECVCEAMKCIFKQIGKVPNKIVFDNATGIGRRIQDELQEHPGFTKFKLAYGFRARFANPRAGYEKGSVENAVNYFRSHCLVPTPTIMGEPRTWSEKVLLPESLKLRMDTLHYKKQVLVSELFEDDLEAMHDLPERDFNVARISSEKLSNTGTLRLDKDHWYTVDPNRGGERILVEKKAWDVNFYDLDGKIIFSTPRLYGEDEKEVQNKIAVLKNLLRKANAWENSMIREDLGDDMLRDYIDRCSKEERHEILYIFSEASENYGYADAEFALAKIVKDGRKPTIEDVATMCDRIQDFPMDISYNPTGVDLKTFDGLLNEQEN